MTNSQESKMGYDEIYYDKLKTAELFNSECALCGKNIKDQDTRKRKRKRIAFTFHHLFYNKGEKTAKDFKYTDDYNKYILPIVRKNPNQFALLHNKCHTAVTWALRFNDEKWVKLSLLRKANTN